MIRINTLRSNRAAFLKWGMFMLLSLLLLSRQSQARIPADSIAPRIQFLNKSLQYDQKGTRQWWYSWLGIYGGLTAGQVAGYFVSNETSTRQDMALGAATAFVGVLGQFISPFQPVSFADKICMLPEGSIREQHEKLTQMERLLAERSLMETETRKWKAHIVPTSINLVSGLVTWVGFHRTFWDGVVNFGMNCVITESQIWTQPIRAKRALKRYREQFAADGLSVHPRSEFNCNFIVSANGAGIRVIF